MNTNRNNINMKTNIYTWACAALITLGACNELEPEIPNFSVEASQMEVVAGEPVTFFFEGNPNFITFFSGEEGHQYVNRNRETLDASEIDSSYISFNTELKYGAQKNSLRVYLSKDFPGLTLKDTVADRELIQTHQWVDITEQCKLIDGKLTKVEKVSLDDYRDNMTLAFQFIGSTKASPQRTAIVSNLKVTNVLQSGKSIGVADASQLNFSCFDITPSNPENNCYKKITSGALIKGSWSLIEIAKNKMQLQGGASSAKPWADNDDWLISTPMKLNKCMPDTGESIKDINRRVTQYNHTFTTPGTYTVSFLAGNSNIEGDMVELKEVTITVTE